MQTDKKIDIIVPVYKPGKELFALLDGLNKQDAVIESIILLNTEKQYFDALVDGTDFQNNYRNVKVFHLSKQEFDHGKTRRMGVEKSRADIFVMMTQDALPADETLISRLVMNLQGEVAVSYARQLPASDCSPEERYSRNFNYPADSYVKGKDDLLRMGIKTFFCSDVCAAYRREIYEELGGFVEKTIFNEDMLFAAKAVEAGYKIAYEAEAAVYHSHNYTNMQQLRRNFDMGVSQAQYSSYFEGLSSESEGMKLVKDTTKYLWKHKRKWRILYFYIQCAYKYSGYLLGKRYKKLPRKMVLFLTSNKDYWI